jgi:hypothetical protein
LGRILAVEFEEPVFRVQDLWKGILDIAGSWWGFFLLRLLIKIGHLVEFSTLDGDGASF